MSGSVRGHVVMHRAKRERSDLEALRENCMMSVMRNCR
jgi:hypothetical protein